MIDVTFRLYGILIFSIKEIKLSEIRLIFFWHIFLI